MTKQYYIAMKTTIFSMLLATGTLLLPACSGDETTVTYAQPSDVAVQFSATNAAVTRTAADGTWTRGELMSFFMMNEDGSAVYPSGSWYTYKAETGGSTSAIFSPITVESTAYYPEDDSKVKFFAYGNIEEIYMQDNNTIKSAILPAPDLLIAATTASYSMNNPSAALNFKHACAMVEVTVKNNPDISQKANLTEAVLLMEGTLENGTWSIADGKYISGTGNTRLSQKLNADHKATFMVYPTPAGRELIFTVTDADNKKYTGKLTLAEALEGGYKNTFTFTVSPKVDVAFTGSIEGWKQSDLGDITADED